MRYEPARKVDHGVVAPSGRHNLSIRFQPDGLSFAYADEEGLHTGTIGLPPGDPFEALPALQDSGAWPETGFSEVRVCVPTDIAVLIPAEADRPETREKFIRSLGFPTGPDTRIIASALPGESVLLHAVCRQIVDPMRDKFGDTLSFFHPLAVSLGQPDAGTVLQVDSAGGYANITLSHGSGLTVAEVYPLENEATLLLLVNRTIVANKVGSLRIVCSGENCRSYADLLAQYYREVSVHPDGENRNLFHPFR